MVSFLHNSEVHSSEVHSSSSFLDKHEPYAQVGHICNMFLQMFQEALMGFALPAVAGKTEEAYPFPSSQGGEGQIVVGPKAFLDLEVP